MFNGSDLNEVKEKILLNFPTTEDHASLLEDQDSDRELFILQERKRRPNIRVSKKGINLKNGKLNFRIVVIRELTI
jgi:hypothetical protein